MVYLDDGENVYKLAIPAKDEKTAREHVQGKGEVIAVKEVERALNFKGCNSQAVMFITVIKELNILWFLI